MRDEKIYQLALSCIPNIGPVQVKRLLEYYERPQYIFEASFKELKNIEQIGEARARDIRDFRDFDVAAYELDFMDQHGINLVFYTDSRYPHRLRNCFDPPIFLFAKGDMELNVAKIIAVVGTRSNSSYGKSVTEELIQSLKGQKGILVVSGLALGIDAIAHRACLENGIPTVGVLGHGLGSIYPFQHKSLAEKMMECNGGILSEFFHEVAPDKYNFPRRNRVVAGLADATIVVETATKGGSMITAELANGYNRDVFAVPGKLTDAKSAGCNWLIANKKAELYGSPKDFMQLMGWDEVKKANHFRQRQLFVDFDENEFVLVKILEEKNGISIDELAGLAEMSQGKTASALLNLELKGVVESLPGKRYALV
ncbi:MAG: DNA-processing protein DprA [Chitinophagaceae bacterium]